MKKLTKTLTIMVTVIATLAFTATTAEAAQKAYPAKASTKLYSIGCIGAGECKIKNGDVSITNSGYITLHDEKYNYIMYYEKANGINVSKVKTPTKKSKKITGTAQCKTFKITKDTTFKFKVVKKNATKTQIKKAKTYYLTVKVNNVSPFNQSKETVTIDGGDSITISVDKPGLANDEKIYVNGKSVKDSVDCSCTHDSKTYKWIYTIKNITKPSTVKYVAYKNGKKIGTKTYTVKLKTYTLPSKYTFHTIKSNWVLPHAQPIAYFTDGSDNYLSECFSAGTKVPDGFKLVEKYNGKSGYNYKLNEVNTYYYELYRARYYKVNGEYKFASWEFIKKGTETYKVWKNTFSAGFVFGEGWGAPKSSYTAGYEGLWCYCYKKGEGDSGVVYRIFLMPGEKLNPEYTGITFELMINGEREWTTDQADYEYVKGFTSWCTHDMFMEAYNGLHDELNTTTDTTMVTPDVPQ